MFAGVGPSPGQLARESRQDAELLPTAPACAAPAALQHCAGLRCDNAQQRFDADADFQQDARAEVVRLQAGDAESREAWRLLCAQSEKAFNQVYATLNIDERLETRGESFYNPRLPAVLETLEESGLLVESDGAWANLLVPDRTGFRGLTSSSLVVA